ncbi:hypothetical protein Acr_00g0099940 [Actinidia rufa]|uniref:Uncharacterized protein n=1 Tax=Actinidia rufa TaxID=165716 RepID=A0A7J0E1G5_9ERIC|nr:hypothetical protein Acr_00g0099940 [Actinidia rufa]
MVLIKYALNNPTGDEPNPDEPNLVLRPWGQRNQGLSKGFFMNTIKNGIDFDSSEEEREDKMEYENMHEFESVCAMDVERILDIVPFQIEGTQGPPNVQGQEGNERVHKEEHVHEGVNEGEEYPTHGACPSQEGIRLKENHWHGFLGILMSYKHPWGKLSNDKKKSFKTKSDKSNTWIDLETHTMNNLQQLYNIHADLEGLWNILGPHPPPLPFDPTNAPARPFYFCEPPY